MNTTIPLTKETKKKLFLLKSRLEQDEGRPINYDEFLQILIRDTQKSRTHTSLSDFQKLKGVLSANAAKMFEKERELDLLTEERKGEE